jgi:SecD/SecF fusion protein
VFLVALLTVIGYFVNDSVVIFDRVRELRRFRPRDPLPAVVNDACLQTVPGPSSAPSSSSPGCTSSAGRR